MNKKIVILSSLMILTTFTACSKDMLTKPKTAEELRNKDIKITKLVETKTISDSINEVAKAITPTKTEIENLKDKTGKTFLSFKDITKSEWNKLSTTIKDKYNEKGTNSANIVHTNYYKILGPYDGEFKGIEKNQIHYLELDSLKRPTGVVANITQELIDSSTKRDAEKMADPIGWPKTNNKVEFFDKNGHYKGYFWNRSHLLADSLGGSCDYNNMIAGTRMQNVGMKNQGGMAYSEEKARNFLKKNRDKSLIYEVYPKYYADELIPRSVIVNMISSDGTISEKIEVFNIAPGYEINYYDGNVTKININ